MSVMENLITQDEQDAADSYMWRQYMDIDLDNGGLPVSHVSMSYDVEPSLKVVPAQDSAEAYAELVEAHDATVASYAAALEAQSEGAADSAAAKVIEAATGFKFAA